MSTFRYDYNIYGTNYSSARKTEPAIAAYIEEALGEAKTVINIGAGTGSYESENRFVISVEPAEIMRRQRLEKNKFPAIRATAVCLPFDDLSFDAATAFLTVHHWTDMVEGLKEVRRVTKGKIIIMTYDPDSLHLYWNAVYFPEVVDVERRRYPPLASIMRYVGNECEVIKIPVPLQCADGFQEAFYGRPEAFLLPEVRAGMSAWSFIPEQQQNILAEKFRSVLSSGEWDKTYGDLRTQPFFNGALRLIIGKP